MALIQLLGAGGGGGSDPSVKTGSVQTLDAVPTTVLSIPMTANAATYVESVIVGRKDSGAGAGAWKLQITIQRDGAGNNVQVGIATIEQYNEQDTVAIDAVYSVGSTDLIIEVTGIALETWEWSVRAVVVESIG